MASSFSLVCNDTSGLSLGDLTPRVQGQPSSNASVQINHLQDYLSRLASGAGSGSYSVSVSADALVAASGVVTCSGVLAADTVTLNGTTLTAVDINEKTTVVCGADTAGSLNSTFFNLYSAGDATKYYVWYNVNSAGVDPAVANSTGIEVAIATGALATAVATATQLAVDALVPFIATVNSATVTIRNATSGVTTNASDGTAATGFTITVTVAGGVATNNQFAIGISDTECAANLVTCITSSTTALVSGLVTASSLLGVVTLAALTKGIVGNAYTVSSSNGSRLAITGTTNGRLISGTGGFSSNVISYSFGA